MRIDLLCHLIRTEQRVRLLEKLLCMRSELRKRRRTLYPWLAIDSWWLLIDLLLCREIVIGTNWIDQTKADPRKVE